METAEVAGIKIYNDIKSLHGEIDELKRTLDIIEDSIGSGSATYRILKESYSNKKLQLQQLQQRRYIVVTY